MRTYEAIKEAMDTLEKHWGKAGKEIATMCLNDQLNIDGDHFLKKCTACGGNWGGMFLSGIKRARPEIREVIPDNMGNYAWVCILSILILLNVNFDEKSA